MVVITVPHAKPPGEETGAVEFASMLSDAILNLDHIVLYGQDHSNIVDVETVDGKDSPYARDYYSKLKEHNLHLNIRSFEADDENLMDYDVMLAFLPSISSPGKYEGLQNLLDDYGVVSIVEVPYSNHRLSLVSETLFDTPSVTIYVNEGAVDLYEVFVEQVVAFVVQAVAQTPQ